MLMIFINFVVNRLARRPNSEDSAGNPVVTIHECDSDDEPVIYRDDSDEC